MTPGCSGQGGEASVSFREKQKCENLDYPEFTGLEPGVSTGTCRRNSWKENKKVRHLVQKEMYRGTGKWKV